MPAARLAALLATVGLALQFLATTAPEGVLARLWVLARRNGPTRGPGWPGR